MKTRKSKFQERLNELLKKTKENSSPASQINQSQTAQTPGQKRSAGQSQSAQPPNPYNDFKWKHVSDELPPYYSAIHIWDGQRIHFNWTRVWSETLGNIYVNKKNDNIITKITHWSPPEGEIYPKYEPLTENDVKRYTTRDIQYLIGKMKDKLITNVEMIPNDRNTRISYNTGIKSCITILNELQRMTDKKKPR